jgi:ribonuclease P protein component
METLKKNYEFSRVYRKGRYVSGQYLAINILENIYKHNRIGISVSKKAYKSSVKRNLLRRRIKEIIRTAGFNLKEGHDIVFVVKKTELGVPEFADLKREIGNLLVKAKLTVKNEENTNQND